MKSQIVLSLAVSLLLAFGMTGCGDKPQPTTVGVVASPKEYTGTSGLPVEITNSVGMTFVLIRPGDFLMGTTKAEMDYTEDERQRRVRIARPFYLGATEVTQGQWESVMRTRPWTRPISHVREGPDYAATCMSWEEAVDFCDRLSVKEGVIYRLPTEEEWEYACRGGTTTVFHFGDEWLRMGEFEWFEGNAQLVGDSFAHEVARKKPNPFGLYDMHGNVTEWCGGLYYREDELQSRDNPLDPTERSCRAIRGGSWNFSPWGCSSSIRNGDLPSEWSIWRGFRVVRAPADESGARAGASD